MDEDQATIPKTRKTMRPANILIIEDDKYVARTIERCLQSDRYQVKVASNGNEGLQLARENPPDLVILDIIMRGMDGYAVCRAMRAEPSLQETPVLFLTAKIKQEDKIAGFRVGADDYLCKPFNVDELLLRVQAILRRTLDPARVDSSQPLSSNSSLNGSLKSTYETGNLISNAYPAGEHSHAGADSHSLVVGMYILDAKTYELETPGRGKVRLTPIQFDLLYHLMTHPGEAFPPARLLNEVWDYPIGRGSSDLVRVHVKTLRERIEDDPSSPSFLRTVPGKGYMVSANIK